MSFLWIIIGLPLGFLIIKNSEKIINITGDIGWAEKVLGTGSSYTVMKFVGIFIILFSVLYPLGGCDRIIHTLTKPFAG